MTGQEHGGREAPVPDVGFRALLDRLAASHNFDFREYKEVSLARRIRARMAQVHAETFDEYLGYLDRHPGEHVALFNTILINVTAFLRDPEAWTVLARDVLPGLVDAGRDARTLRIWCAGCASGEEVYSTAILLAEHLGERANEWAIRIYGTDIDEDALAAARHAVYRSDALTAVPDALVQKHFVRDGPTYRVRRELRRWCIFGSHNLISAPPIAHLDLLVCRNVLIYFTSELQQRIIARFHYALREDGILFLGRSESLLARSGLFAAINPRWRIFRRIPLPDGTPARLAQPDQRRPDPLLGSDVPAAPGRLQLALDALPLAVIIVDPADTVVVWSAGAESLLDIPASGAVARKFRDLDVSYRIEGLRARLEEAKTRQVTSRMPDATFTRRNGDLVHAHVTIVPLVEADRLPGVLVTIEDITERMRLQEQMRRIVEQHATALEELQSTNEELETTNEELQSTNEELETTNEELQSTNEELETTNEELQSTNEELETTIDELQAANAELVALNAEVETRSAELNRLDVYHHSVLDSLEEGVMAFDRALVIRGWNAAAERMWGVPADRAVGQPFASLPLGDAPRTAMPALRRVVEGGAAEEVLELSCSVPGSGSRPARLRVLPLRSTSGDTIGAVAILAAAPDQPGGLASS